MPDRFPFYVTEQLSEHMYETPEGFLVCVDVPIARIGEYVYKNNEVPVEGGKDGIVKILRDEDQVFSDATIKSFEGKPVTINHPDDFVTPENWKELSHGNLQNVHRGEGNRSDLLISDIIITTEDAIKLVKSGLRQVSCGYDAQYEQIEPGLGKQKDIVGNHLALVVKGRAGNRCAIMDTACTCCGNCSCKTHINDKEEEIKMDKKSKNGVKDVLKRIFPKLNLDSVKDEDLEMGEGTEGTAEGGGDLAAAQQAAAEAKAAAVQAVEAAKKAAEVASGIGTQAESAEADAGEELQEGNEEGMEAEGEGGAVILESVNAKLDSLTALVQQLIDAVSEDEEEGMEAEGEEEGLDSEAEGIEEEKEEEVKDEGEDENIAEKLSKTTTDAIWQDTISRADVIAPGIVATKPKATDLKKVVLTVKRKALSDGMTKDHATIIKPLLQGKKISMLTEDALNTAFIAASEMIKKVNNVKVQKKVMQMKDMSSHSEIAQINKRNQEFWKKK